MSTLPRTAPGWRSLPADLPGAVRPQVDEIVQAVALAVMTTTPDFVGLTDPKFLSDVRTAVRVALARFLDLVGTDQPALSPELREIFLGLGAAEAREDRGPQGLVSAYRTAAHLLARRTTEVLARSRTVDVEEVLNLTEAISAYVDALVEASTEGFARQVREQAGERDRRRRHLADLLLRGTASVEVLDAAATGAGWPVPTRVIPVLLPADLARQARFRHSAEGIVTERDQDAVLLLGGGPRSTRDVLTGALPYPGAVVGPALRPAEVPVGIRLAELTRALTDDRTPDNGPVVFVDDHLSTLVLRGEPGALAVLSERRLAPLSGLSATRRERLLATLRSWLRHWGSRAEVAAELYVHPQTVSYRLTQLRDLFGAELDDPAARFELLLVLSARPPSPVRPGSSAPAGL